MPHVHVAVEAMQRAGYRLAVICNTGMAGGSVLREVLKRHGLFDAFDVTVFSNEFGLAKPHPGIFEHTLAALGGIEPRQALHVGDLEELDVEGARAGARALRALRAGHATAAIETDADIVVTDWRDFGDQIAAYERAPERPADPEGRAASQTGPSPPVRALPLRPAVTVADPLENVRAWWDEDAEIDLDAYDPAVRRAVALDARASRTEPRRPRTSSTFTSTASSRCSTASRRSSTSSTRPSATACAPWR